MNNIYIYSDASFDKESQQAIIGFALFQSELEHNTVSLTDLNPTLIQISESNNIRAELRSAIASLKSCVKTGHVTLITDCQTISDLPDRRQKLEQNNFISHSKQTFLNNKDLYQQFYQVFDQLQPKLVRVKGHTKAGIQTQIDKNFSQLDKLVRHRLRKIR